MHEHTSTRARTNTRSYAARALAHALTEMTRRFYLPTF